MKVEIDIITCPQWGARRPKQGLTTVGKSSRIIIHHTAGHHREISNPKNESVDEAIRYARDIQNFHMDDNGWVDSGHNFLVTRAGQILQGRWLTVSAIEARHMVLSAHCPGQNDQIGIEHEHLGNEKMSNAQRKASAQLIAWISWKYGSHVPLPLYPHKKFYATACPVNLVDEIPHLHSLAAGILEGA
jgi:hypothetical protein